MMEEKEVRAALFLALILADRCVLCGSLLLKKLHLLECHLEHRRPLRVCIHDFVVVVLYKHVSQVSDTYTNPGCPSLYVLILSVKL